ncbi:hyaluronan-binding protein 2-like [Gigantopelta aegis]|uniref:hyaluronan-binding protein 2-like n=1 Tax=Gigantopelta aegis TaxID=1735272 RepID=UPI001B888952|nr:hyaluronan-binding protein 2-like [Gigantopelta aegis]
MEIKTFQHPGYIRTSNFPNDIALLQLDEPVDLESGDARVACIPDPQDQIDLVHNSRCWISGWGETRGSHSSHWSHRGCRKIVRQSDRSHRSLKGPLATPVRHSSGCRATSVQTVLNPCKLLPSLLYKL